MPKFTTVVFDLDGTLVDGSADIADAMNKALFQVGVAPVTPQQVASYLGGGPMILVEKCLGAARSDLSEDQLLDVLNSYSDFYRANPAAKTNLMDTAATTIPRLFELGVKIGICTNKRTAIAREVLDAVGLGPYVQTIIGSDLAEAPKPSGLHLLQTASALGVSPQAVLYVGDTAIDSAAAASAGINYAHVVWGEEGVPAQHLVQSFDALISLII